MKTLLPIFLPFAFVACFHATTIDVPRKSCGALLEREAFVKCLNSANISANEYVRALAEFDAKAPVQWDGDSNTAASSSIERDENGHIRR